MVDNRYNIISIADDTYKNSYELNSYQRVIFHQGFFLVKLVEKRLEVKFYNPYIAYILLNRNLEVIDLDNKEKKIFIDCTPYFETFVENYYKGIENFEKEFSVSHEYMLSNGRVFVADLQKSYFRKDNKNNDIGWIKYKNKVPQILTHSVIETYGFYNGMIHKVEELKKKYPNLFEDFDKYSEKIKFQSEHFNHEIFKDQNSYNLFLFLVEKYAINKSVGQFTQIYYWLQENKNSIKNNVGTKYRKFVKDKYNLPEKYSRLEDKKPYETATLNEFFKEFSLDK